MNEKLDQGNNMLISSSHSSSEQAPLHLPPGMAEQILKAVSDSIIVLDRNFKIIWANEECVRGQEQFLPQTRGRHCYEVVEKNYHTFDGCPINETFRTKKPASRECLCELASKSGVWIESNTWPLLDGQGEIIYVVQYSRDITARKRAAKALQEERDRAQKYLDIAGVMLVVLDAEERVIAVNKKGCQVLEAEEREIVGQKWFDNFIPPRYRPERKAVFQRLMAGEIEPCSYMEGPLLTKKGVEKVIGWHHTVLKDEQGRILATLSSGQDITAHKQAEEDLKQSIKRLQTILEETVMALSSTLELRDPYTASHQKRVTKLAYAIAREMKLPPEQIEGLRIAAILHDIGKIQVPVDILNKPGSLTHHEMELIKAHALAGYEILKRISFPWPVAQIVLQHHERMNGLGYPAMLKGEEILPEAKILGVADVVEGMASHRPYRPAPGLEQALEEISRNRGVLYDAEVVDACLRTLKDNNFIFEKL